MAKQYDYIITYTDGQQARRVKELLRLAGFDVKTAPGRAVGAKSVDLFATAPEHVVITAACRLMDTERSVVTELKLALRGQIR